MTKTLTLTDASEHLGVHYMTAYRYVRTGRLAAVKRGGQWEVSLDDLESFGATADSAVPRTELIPPMLVERLVAADENGVFQLLESAMASGADAEEVYLDLLGVALAIIGDRWNRGNLSIAEEHLASATAMRVICRLGPRVALRGRTRGTILLATVADDHHFLPTALVRDLLRSRGFAAVDLGGNTPPESVVEQAEAIGSNLLAIGISATTPGADDTVRSMIAAITKSLEVPIVVGGYAFRDAEHITSLGPCTPSSSARDALDIFDAIHAEARSR